MVVKQLRDAFYAGAVWADSELSDSPKIPIPIILNAAVARFGSGGPGDQSEQSAGGVSSFVDAEMMGPPPTGFPPGSVAPPALSPELTAVLDQMMDELRVGRETVTVRLVAEMAMGLMELDGAEQALAEIEAEGGEQAVATKLAAYVSAATVLLHQSKFGADRVNAASHEAPSDPTPD